MGKVLSAIVTAALLVASLFVVTVRPAAADVNCTEIVDIARVGVHESPDTNSVIRKFKYRGDRMFNPGCRWAEDAETGTGFRRVVCGCATDGFGWVNSQWVRTELGT
jgi:hypothetical protein